MYYLRRKADYLLIFNEDNIIIYDCNDGSHKNLKIPDPPFVSDPIKRAELLKSESKSINYACISENNEYTAVSLLNKQLTIYDNQFKVLLNTTTKRVISKMRFTPLNDILIADKTGDVYLYSLGTETEPKLLLGHLSMLLDVVVSDCMKFIITCDRDEKIRISHYPNSYNIQNYCLGHKEFVTNLEVIGNVLISASGDGTVRFWDYMSGKELAQINTNEFLGDKTITKQFCESMNEDRVEISAVPVTDMQIFRRYNSDVFLAVSLFDVNEIQVYRANFECGAVNVRHLMNITLNSRLCCFSLSQKLFILTEGDLLVYNLNNQDSYSEENSDKVRLFYEKNKELFRIADGEWDYILSLYKRKFDNVQEYLSRKKQRIESKVS